MARIIAAFRPRSILATHRGNHDGAGTRRGYIVRTAASIAESLKVAHEYEFDMLVSDIGLPDGRGTELLQQIGELRGKRPPSIARSGFRMEEDLERSR